MEYNILIETDFFNLLNAGHKNKGGNALENSYREFIKVVVDLCSTNVKQAVFALSYAETELDFHLSMPHIKDCLGTVGLYVRKAIAFVRRMQEHVAATYHLHVTTSTSEASPPVSSESKPLVKWTGNAVDLVEMVYTRVRDNILKSKEQKNIQPTKGGHKMVTCQNYVSLFYCQITSCPSDGEIS